MSATTDANPVTAADRPPLTDLTPNNSEAI